MAYQAIGLGTTAGDGTGDTIRGGGGKINDNFAEIYTLLGTGTALTSGISATATVVTLASPVISGVLTLDNIIINGTNIGHTSDTDAMAIAANGVVTFSQIPVMPANSIDSDQYVNGSIDLVHMSANSVDSDQYVDGSIDLAHMSANSVDSDQYVDGSIDTAHIADNQITLAKMAGIARGKIIYGDASGDPAVLTAGSNGQVLTSDGTDISWAATPAASDTVAGVAELSTDAETITGIDTGRVTTPANITAKMTAPGPIGGTTAAAASFTTISATGNITLGDAANINMSVPLLAGADHTFTGLSAQMLAGGTIAAFDLVCVHTITQEVVTADASAYATARVIGIAPAAISDTATGTVLLHGFIRDDTWAWTTGSTLYLSETAGAMTHTAPSTDGAFVQVVGVALSPDVVYINPSMDVIERA